MNNTEKLVYGMAKELLKANNTVTTLEIKTALRKISPTLNWKQQEVSDAMNNLSKQGLFTYTDNSVYRTYSAVKQQNKTTKTMATTTNKKGSISRTAAIDMIRNSKGHFFTVTFTKKDGSLRTMNCQYSKDVPQRQSHLGYVTVMEVSEKAPKNVNTQTLSALKIGGKNYSIK